MMWAIGCLGWLAICYIIIRLLVEHWQLSQNPMRDILLSLACPFVLIYALFKEIYQSINRAATHNYRSDAEKKEQEKIQLRLNILKAKNAQCEQYGQPEKEHRLSRQQKAVRRQYFQQHHQNKILYSFYDNWTFDYFKQDYCKRKNCSQHDVDKLYHVAYDTIMDLTHLIAFFKTKNLWFDDEDDMYQTPCLYWTLNYFFRMGECYYNLQECDRDNCSGYSLTVDLVIAQEEHNTDYETIPDGDYKIYSDNYQGCPGSIPDSFMVLANKYNQNFQRLSQEHGERNCHLIGYPEQVFGDIVFTSPMRAQLMSLYGDGSNKNIALQAQYPVGFGKIDCLYDVKSYFDNYAWKTQKKDESEKGGENVGSYL